MPATRYWMVSNRKPITRRDGTRELGPRDERKLRYYTAPIETDQASIGDLRSWSELSASAFRQALVDATSSFPSARDVMQEDQQHFTIFVHGYNNGWDDAANRYRDLVQKLYAGGGGLGECALFAWPSNGSPADYLADRGDARRSADDLADVLSDLYEWLRTKQGVRPELQCRAKTSLIAHSMGAYVVERAMHHVWDRKNRPLWVSLINQLLMVAADVDNDLFAAGEQLSESNGEGIANLAYRVTALYTGLDSVLGLSSGLKHFGKRRLGRSGLDHRNPLPDNVWDIDITPLFEPTGKFGTYHSAAFDSPRVVQLIRELLRGVDRRILVYRRVAPGGAEAIAVTPLASEGVGPVPRGPSGNG